MRFDLWAAISYGQNLEPVGLVAAVELLCAFYGDSMEGLKFSVTVV